MHPRDTPDTRSVRLAIRLRNPRARASERASGHVATTTTTTTTPTVFATLRHHRPPRIVRSLSDGQLRVNLSAHSKFGAPAQIETRRVPRRLATRTRRIGDNALSRLSPPPPPPPLARPYMKLPCCLAENLTARGVSRALSVNSI